MGGSNKLEILLTITDYLILSKLVFDWADSYDAKVNPPFPSESCELFKLTQTQDWNRLRSIIAPTLTVCSSIRPSTD